MISKNVNLIKLQDDLKDMPDGYIRQLGLNPKEEIPPWMVTSELLRRKKMRESFQGAAQGEQPTINEQLVSGAQPQLTGVASLPAANVGDEAAYAAGGIVAFEDGGSVQGYQSKGLVQLSPEELARLSPEEQTRYLAEQAAANQAALRGIGLFSLPQTAPTAATPQIRGTLPPLTESEMSQYKLPKAVEARQPMYQNVSSEVLQNTPRVRTAPDGAPITQAPVTKQTQRDDDIAPPRAPAAQGIGSLYQAPANPWADYTPTPAVTAEDEMARMRGVLGVDPFQAKSAERLAAMEGRAAKEEQTAPWMALAEAGFAMAGGDSPYALQNIGRGAQKGVESLAKAKERAAAAEEKRFGIEAEIARAKRAEDTAIAKYGFDSEQASKESERREKLEKRKGTADYETRVAENKFNAEKFKLEYAQREQEIAINAAKADKQIAATTNQMEKEMLKARLSSLTTRLEEINKQMKEERLAGNDEEVMRLKSDFESISQQLNSLGTSGKLVKGADGKLRYQQ